MAQNSSHDVQWLTNTRTEMFLVYAGNTQSSCLVVGEVESYSTYTGSRPMGVLKSRSFSQNKLNVVTEDV